MGANKRMIEIDDATALVLEARAAEAGLSVPALLAQWAALRNEPAPVSTTELAELDRQWASIKSGEPTVRHDDVVRWLETWGTEGFRPGGPSR